MCVRVCVCVGGTRRNFGTGVGVSILKPKIVSEYDQEIPQSQTADNPVAPRGRAAQPSRESSKAPNQDDCNTRMDIK